MTLKITLMGQNSILSPKQKMKVIFRCLSSSLKPIFLISVFSHMELCPKIKYLFRKKKVVTYIVKLVSQSMTLHKERDLIVVLSFVFLVLQYNHYHFQILEPSLLLDFQAVVWVSSDYFLIHISFLVA